MPVQQQPMAPMPFYDANRFPTPVWQTTTEQGWTPQGQFIQQIPAGQTIETYPQYTNGIYQTYQQPAFEPNTFYTGAVQVLPNRPPSVPNQQPQLTPRPNSNFSHTPSPVPTQPQQQQVQQQQQQQQNPQQVQQQQQQTQTVNQQQQQQQQQAQLSNRQYQEYNIQGQTFNPPSTPTGNTENQSRPSSVNSVANPPTPNQNYNQQQTTVYTTVSSANFSPSSNASSYANSSSGNDKPGYPQVNSSPQLTSHSSSGYSGQAQYSGHHEAHWQTQDQQQQQQQIMWEQQQQNDMTHDQVEQTNEHYLQHQEINHSPTKMENLHAQSAVKTFSQADKVNLNTRIKTMILNKQQESKIEEPKPVEQNTTGHFLWYSHHHHLDPSISGDGGPQITNNQFQAHQNQNFRLETTSQRHISIKQEKIKEKEKKVGTEIPQCGCFPMDQLPPEPGTYYTHLGCANNLKTLRSDLETRTGVQGHAIRIEKVRFTGKEGKTAQGCPIAKWIIRRSNTEEKYLIIVKHRKGHYCRSTFIVVCIVVWDGVQRNTADELYSMLTEKLNKYGVPTKRRCSTNELRTCACQGLDENTCGASFSFGCAWSMYYNGCKFTRSKDVRKFRLVDKLQENELEERLQWLATYITPLYQSLAPKSFENQCRFESVASDCRLGFRPGRPFSGVTACLDFCAHSHKDLQNMSDGLTVVVTLNKHRGFSKPLDEQLHVLPLYMVEDNGSGNIEVLQRFQSEVRTCSETGPNKTKKLSKRKSTSSEPKSPSVTPFPTPGEIQYNQVSSTVVGIPTQPSYRSVSGECAMRCSFFPDYLTFTTRLQIYPKISVDKTARKFFIELLNIISASMISN